MSVESFGLPENGVSVSGNDINPSPTCTSGNNINPSPTCTSGNNINPSPTCTSGNDINPSPTCTIPKHSQLFPIATTLKVRVVDNLIHGQPILHRPVDHFLRRTPPPPPTRTSMRRCGDILHSFGILPERILTKNSFRSVAALGDSYPSLLLPSRTR